MNIFFTDECPIECAKALDDKRVIKMCLETAQLLSTAINELGGKAPYRSTHVNHPCAKWVRESEANYEWTINHFMALCDEYHNRYGRNHACGELLVEFLVAKLNFDKKDLTEKPNCAANQSLGISYKHIDDVYTAYKLYLSDRWELDKRVPTWYGVRK